MTVMEPNARPPSARGAAWRRAAAALSAAVAMLAAAAPAAIADDGAFAWIPGGGYGGVFAGAGWTQTGAVDTDGFSYSGRSGWSVDQSDGGLVGGVLVGRKFEVGGVPLRIELDGTFGNMSAKTDRIDPLSDPPDETVESELGWIAAARAGIEQAVGPATVFVTAGVALARIENSLTDLDAYRGSDGEWVLLPDGRAARRVDPDDSFRDTSTELGWTIGAGVETSLNDDWTLRLESSYLDFGESTHHANHSGNDPCCGSGTPRRRVSYRIQNEFGLVRVGFIYRFGGR